MANIKSQIKRNRQNDKRHDRNTTVRSALKTSTKKVHTAVGEGDVRSDILREALKGFKARGIEPARARREVHLIATGEMPNSPARTSG